MANLIANALSISGQQEKTSLYQGSFVNPSFASPQASGHALASALGVGGGAVAQYLQAKENRDTKISIDMAEKVVNAQTDADMHRLTAIEMVGNYTKDAELQDNPYAKVLIEKSKGSYLASQAHDEYIAWRSQQKTLNTPEEELARMNDFMNTKYLIAQGTMTDKEAFDKGFNEKSIPMQLQVASMQRTEKATEDRAQQKASLIADLGYLTEHADELGENEVTKRTQVILNQVKAGWMKPSDRMEIIKGFLGGISNHTGDFSLIQKIGNEIGIGVNGKGEIIGVKDVIDVGVFKQNAEITTRNLYGVNVQKALTDMEKLNVAGQNAYFDKLSPEMKGVLVKDRERLANHAKQVEEAKRINEAKAKQRALAKQMVASHIMRQAEAWQEGKTNFPDGTKVASGVGSLPKVEYDDIDPTTGRTIRFSASYDSQDLSYAYDLMHNKIINNPKLSEGEKIRATQRLLLNPIFTDAQKTLVGATAQSIDGLAYAPTDANGNITMTPQLEGALKSYTESPETFLKIYGKDNYVKVGLIVETSKAYGGDFQQGLQAVKRSYNINPQTASDNKSTAHRALSTVTLTDFTDVFGNKVTGSASTNNSAMAQLELLVPQFMNQGDSVETATNKGLNVLRDTYSVYRETLIPKNFWSSVSGENRMQLGQQALDEEVDQMVSLSGCGTRDAVTVTYDKTNNTIQFVAGNNTTIRTLNDLTWLAETIGTRAEDGSQGKTHLQYKDIIQQNKDRQEFRQSINKATSTQFESVFGE